MANHSQATGRIIKANDRRPFQSRWETPPDESLSATALEPGFTRILYVLDTIITRYVAVQMRSNAQSRKEFFRLQRGWGVFLRLLRSLTTMSLTLVAPLSRTAQGMGLENVLE